MTTPIWTPNPIDLQIIDLAFIEDLGLPYTDITTTILFSEFKKNHSQANIISKHEKPITICGLTIVKTILKKLDQQCEIYSNFQDGERVLPGDSLLTLFGPAPILLQVERILLNFLQRLSAIATLTRNYVDAIKHTQASILDTRKTIPGFRHLEKYAVHCGGGVNHRMGLYDAIMIKDTHIDLLGGMAIVLERLPDTLFQKFPVIIEVRDREELTMVLEKASHKITRILLDNMPSDLLLESVNRCSKQQMATEASGNIHLDNVIEIAECGVDFISIGKLTHSAANVDLSMRCDIKCKI